MPIEMTYDHAVGRGVYGGFLGIAILVALVDKGTLTRAEAKEIVEDAHRRVQATFPGSNSELETGANQEWKNFNYL